MEALNKVFYSVVKYDGEEIVGYVYEIDRDCVYATTEIERSAKCTLARAIMWLALCRDVSPINVFKLVRSTYAVEIVDEE